MKVTCSCHDEQHYLADPEAHGRRQFLKLAALGAGAALYMVMDPAKPARAAGNVEAMLLSCMDFRLLDETVRYMEARHLTNGYDHVILAGASLGALTDKFPEWNKTFWDHVKVAKDLHHIKKVIVMDHRDCGAYRVVYGVDYGKQPELETKVHEEHLKKLAAKLKEVHPDLGVELLLMNLDGTVETIAA